MGHSNFIKVFFRTSWIKTLRFNLHYFGWGGWTLPVIIARNMSLKKLAGTVKIESGSGKIFLGRQDCEWITAKGVWTNAGTVIFQGKCFIGNGTVISVSKSASLTFGLDCYFTGMARILCDKSIVIGSGAVISWDTTLMDSDQHTIFNEMHQCINPPQAIVIGAHVWIGMGATLLKGSNIPPGCIVAANSTITKAFTEKNCILAKTNLQIKSNVFWEP